MDEEDTFRILSRPSIHEMVRLYEAWYYERVVNGYSTLYNLEFARLHGWGWVEYLLARRDAGYKPF